jgi:hypothetical protein
VEDASAKVMRGTFDRASGALTFRPRDRQTVCAGPICLWPGLFRGVGDTAYVLWGKGGTSFIQQLLPAPPAPLRDAPVFGPEQDAAKCCAQCPAGYTKYYSIPHVQCGECCLQASRLWFWKIFEPKLLEGNCSAQGYTTYVGTESDGVPHTPLTVTNDRYVRPTAGTETDSVRPPYERTTAGSRLSDSSPRMSVLYA